jgi:hypothetical protein
VQLLITATYAPTDVPSRIVEPENVMHVLLHLLVLHILCPYVGTQPFVDRSGHIFERLENIGIPLPSVPPA